MFRIIRRIFAKFHAALYGKGLVSKTTRGVVVIGKVPYTDRPTKSDDVKD